MFNTICFSLLVVFLNMPLAYSQNILSSQYLARITPVVTREITIPLHVNDDCVSQYMGPNKVQLVCTFELDFTPKPPFSHKLTADGDLYFEYDYNFADGALQLTFIYNAWLDSPNLVPGDEITFKQEVISRFSNSKLNLFLEIIGPI